jgi:class 3 adenylate cyclase
LILSSLEWNPVVEQRVQRRLAAILAADIAGYSRLMGIDEVGTLGALKVLRRETTGDGMLVEFASAVDAVNCAMALQDRMVERDGIVAQKIMFRIGINVGDIIFDDDDIFGDGVNVAARVENECEPGRVCLSASAFEQIRSKTSFSFEDLGERVLKNIDRPVRIYAARATTRTLPAGASSAEPPKAVALLDRAAIAVLPFTNMTDDPGQEYFGLILLRQPIVAANHEIICRPERRAGEELSRKAKQPQRPSGLRRPTHRQASSRNPAADLLQPAIHEPTYHHSVEAPPMDDK